MGFLKKFPAHPFLLAVFIALDAKFHNQAEDISAIDILIASLILSAIFFIVYYFSFLISKRSTAIAIATTIMGFLISFYSTILSVFRSVCTRIGLGGLARHMFIMPLVVLVGASLALYVLRSKKDFSRLNAYLNVLLSVSVVFTLFMVSGANHIWKSGGKMTGEPVAELSEPSGRSGQVNKIHLGYSPDIYFLLFDAYTSSESLLKYWHYDNSAIDNYLENKGFYLVRHSRISIPATANSISDEFNSKVYPQNTPLRNLLSCISNSKVLGFLKTKGYKLINYSIFDISGEKKYYEFPLFDENPELLTLVFYRSLIGTIKSGYFGVIKGINRQFDIMNHLIKGDFARGKSPLFIYAHFLLTHPPALVDKNGHILLNPHASREKGYLDQIYFANNKIKEIVNAIMARYKEPPIIIIQGDHGSRLLGGKVGYTESHTMFDAFYLPEDDYKGYSADMSPICSMRMILNQYYGYE
jgi:uncharacterized protein YggT (Ycf19 family)